MNKTKQFKLHLSDSALKMLEEQEKIYGLSRNQMIEECIKIYYLRNKILKKMSNNSKEILETNDKKE